MSSISGVFFLCVNCRFRKHIMNLTSGNSSSSSDSSRNDNVPIEVIGGDGFRSWRIIVE